MKDKDTDKLLKGCDSTRRTFLRGAAGIAASAAMTGCGPDWFESFARKRFQEMTKKEAMEAIERLREKYKERLGREFSISAAPAAKETLFGYGLDLNRCIGCRRCVYACVKENNQSRAPQIHWIRVLEMEKSKGVSLVDSNHYYEHQKVPAEGHFYMPVQCQQCKHPPCVKVCPVKATWQEPDGIVVIDYDWCIGCRYCMVACPYGARHFNWGEPEIPDQEINTETHVLGNRPRYKGVVEKCTFCIQRVRQGKYPACVEICPTGARKFGNLLDPESEIRYIMEHKRIFILKEELKTEPKFYYFYG
ncbi:MAG: 4Fe-4S dicluster domain-containing protein [Deltaproteobacteria bacterium]|nr:4Fe-4S dicluster domain-containing protein [Deltaproteobacteria bacterium]